MGKSYENKLFVDYKVSQKKKKGFISPEEKKGDLSIQRHRGALTSKCPVSMEEEITWRARRLEMT